MSPDQIEVGRKPWYAKPSSWLAGFNGLLVTYVFSQPILVVGLLGFAPGEWLVPLAGTLGFLAFVLPILVARRESKVQAEVAVAKIEEVKSDAAQQ